MLCSQLTKPETLAFPSSLIFHILFLLHDQSCGSIFVISPITLVFSVVHKPYCHSLSPHQILSALMHLSLHLSPSIQSYTPVIYSLSCCERNLSNIKIDPITSRSLTTGVIRCLGSSVSSIAKYRQQQCPFLALL